MRDARYIYKSDYFYGGESMLDKSINAHAEEGWEFVQMLETSILGNKQILIIYKKKKWQNKKQDL